MGKKCDLCSHMVETNWVRSHYFKTKLRVHGRLSHDTSPPNQIRWFIYILEDIPCMRTYVGSTSDPQKRWRNHKSDCNKKEPSTSSGLSKHFTQYGGCPNDLGRGKETLNFTLVDYIDVKPEDLIRVGHIKGPQCTCSECSRLKDTEDKWILKMGTFYGEGLNTRDQIQAKARCTWSNK